MEDDKILERARKHIMVGIICGVGIGVGILLLIDDAEDFGLFSTPDHPTWIHHWLLGVILIIVGLIALFIYLMLVFGIIK